MAKKNLGMVLWFMAGWFGGSLLGGLFHLPGAFDVIPGIALGVLVRWDPTGAIWSRSLSGKRIVRPINEFAAELDRRAAGPARNAQEQRSGR